jgi:hypothetical protein
MLEGTTPIEVAKHGFKNFKEAEMWARQNVVGKYKNADTGDDLRISNKTIGKYISESAVTKSVNKDVHLSTLKILPEVVKTALLKEVHADRANDQHIKDIQRLYGSVNYEGTIYPVKLTVKRYQNHENKVYSYEVIAIENPTADGQGFNGNPLGNLNKDQASTNSDGTLIDGLYPAAQSRSSATEKGSTDTYGGKGSENNLDDEGNKNNKNNNGKGGDN